MPSANDRVLSTDISTIVTTVAAVYGTGTGDSGYGLSAVTLPTPSNRILASELTSIVTAINTCLAHQGSGSALSSLAANARALATDVSTESTNATTITTNRLTAAAGDMTLVLTALGNVRASAWGGGGGAIACTFNVTWADEDHARYFFNSGGYIRIRLSHPGGTAQDNDWANTLANKVGNVTITAHGTTNSGSVQASATSTGYYEATATGIYNGSSIGGGAYSSDSVIVAMTALSVSHTRGGNGTGFQITVTLTDSHTGPVDSVSAGTAINVDYLSATVQFTAPVPTISLISGF